MTIASGPLYQRLPALAYLGASFLPAAALVIPPVFRRRIAEELAQTDREKSWEK